MLRHLRAFLVVVIVAIVAHDARADCVSPEPALVWSLPARDETGVPANAKLWLFVQGATPTVDVDGRRAQPTETLHMFDPGPLDPGEHTVVVSMENFEGGDVVVDSFVFTSDEGTVEPTAEGPIIASIERNGLQDLPAFCGASIAAFGCLDTGASTFVVDTEPATGFLVTPFFRKQSQGPTVLWPGECGNPTALTYFTEQRDACVAVATIGFAGVSPTTRRCEDAISCAQSRAPSSIVVLAMLLLATCLGRRR